MHTTHEVTAGRRLLSAVELVSLLVVVAVLVAAVVVTAGLRLSTLFAT